MAKELARRGDLFLVEYCGFFVVEKIQGEYGSTLIVDRDKRKVRQFFERVTGGLQRCRISSIVGQ